MYGSPYWFFLEEKMREDWEYATDFMVQMKNICIFSFLLGHIFWYFHILKRWRVLNIYWKSDWNTTFLQLNGRLFGGDFAFIQDGCPCHKALSLVNFWQQIMLTSFSGWLTVQMQMLLGTFTQLLRNIPEWDGRHEYWRTYTNMEQGTLKLS